MDFKQLQEEEDNHQVVAEASSQDDNYKPANNDLIQN
jgi:hypothetical protein